MFHNNSLSNMLTASDSILTGEFLGDIDNDFTFSPPSGSFRNMFTSSPVKSPSNGSKMNRPVLLSELTDEYSGVYRKKSYCSYVYPYDNRRCTNLVAPTYKLEENFCSRHQHVEMGDVTSSTNANHQRINNKYQNNEDLSRYLKDELSPNVEQNLNEHYFLKPKGGAAHFSGSFFHGRPVNDSNPTTNTNICHDLDHLASMFHDIDERMNAYVSSRDAAAGGLAAVPPSRDDVVDDEIDGVIWNGGRQDDEERDDDDKLNDEAEDMLATLDKEFQNHKLNAKVVKDLKQAFVDVMETQGTDQLELKDFPNTASKSSPGNLVINKDSIAKSVLNTQDKDEVILQLETALSAGRSARKKSEALQQKKKQRRPAPASPPPSPPAVVPQTPTLDLPLLESFMNGPDEIKHLTLELSRFHELKKVATGNALRCVCPPPMKSKIQTLPKNGARNNATRGGKTKDRNVPCPNCPIPSNKDDTSDYGGCEDVLKSLDDRSYWVPSSDGDDDKVEMNLKALSKIKKMCKRQLRKETNRLKALTAACSSHPTACGELLMSSLCTNASSAPSSSKRARVQIMECGEETCSNTPLPYTLYCKDHVYNSKDQHLYMNEDEEAAAAATTTTKAKQANKQPAKKRKTKTKTAQQPAKAKNQEKQQRRQLNVYKLSTTASTTPLVATNSNKTVLIDHTDQQNNVTSSPSRPIVMDNAFMDDDCLGYLQSFSNDPQVAGDYWMADDDKLTAKKNSWLCDGDFPDSGTTHQSHDDGFGGLFPLSSSSPPLLASGAASLKSSVSGSPLNLFDDDHMNPRHQLTEDDGGSHELLVDTFEDMFNQLSYPPLINMNDPTTNQPQPHHNNGEAANLCCPPPRPAQIPKSSGCRPQQITNGGKVLLTTNQPPSRSSPVITFVSTPSVAAPPAPKRSKPSLVTTTSAAASCKVLATKQQGRGRGRGARKVNGGAGRKQQQQQQTGGNRTKLQQIQQHLSGVVGGLKSTPAVVRNGGGKRTRGGAKAASRGSRLLMNSKNAGNPTVMNKKQMNVVSTTTNKMNVVNGATIISPVQQLRLVPNSNLLCSSTAPSKENSGNLVYLIPVSPFVPQRSNNGGNKTNTTTTTTHNYNFAFPVPQQGANATTNSPRQQQIVKSIHVANNNGHHRGGSGGQIQRGNSGQLIVINPNGAAQQRSNNQRGGQQTYVVHQQQQQKRKAANDQQPQTTLIRMHPQRSSQQIRSPQVAHPIQLQVCSTTMNKPTHHHQLITSRPAQQTKVTSVKLCNGGIISNQTDTGTARKVMDNPAQSVLVGQVGSLSNNPILTGGGTIRPTQVLHKPGSNHQQQQQPKNCRIITCCTSSASPLTSSNKVGKFRISASAATTAAVMMTSSTSAALVHMNQSGGATMVGASSAARLVMVPANSSVATSAGGRVARQQLTPIRATGAGGGLSMTSLKASATSIVLHKKISTT